MAEGIDGLTRLGAIADRLMLRTAGCEGCALSGTCRVCRPLAKHYQEVKAPLHSYCQHGERLMTQPVPVTILPGPPASARRAAPPVATASITAVQDLDVIVESAECSCDAGDDNPH